MRTQLAAVVAAAATATVAMAAVVPAHADTKPTPVGQTTIAGADRYATAVALSQKTFEHGASGIALAVVATGDTFPDGLAGAAIAGNQQGPLLLTPATTLRADVAAELKRLAPSAVMIAGGTGAVSDRVMSQIKAALPGADVFRTSGATRYATAAAMSADLYADGASTVYITSGRTYADAVSTSSAAALTSGPLLLADTTLPAATLDELKRLKAKNTVQAVVVMGGSAAVSDAVYQQIDTLFGLDADGNPKTLRVSGADRYATSARLASILWDPASNPPAKTAFYANGAAWPDALAAGAAAAADKNDAPVLLTGPTCMPKATKDWDTASSSTLTARVWVGGTATATTKGC